MKLEHSPALQRAFDRARHLAQSRKAAEVDARHLLLALLREEDGKPVICLIDAGADWPRLRAHLGLPMQMDAANPPDVPLHPVLQVVMKQAREMAILHAEEGTISTDHVLLALLTVNHRLCEELAEFGFDLARLNMATVGNSPPLALDEPLLIQDMKEEVNTARILDAGANRAREAMRVLEDFARFSLGDAFLSAELKQLRHGFAHALSELPPSLLLEARDTLNDVGTSISTEQEWQRPSLHAVAQANAKRLQEALRSLEEYGKVVSVGFAEQIEKLRYESYTLERAIVQGAGSRERLADCRLCVLVTDALCKHSLVGTVKEAALGGAQMIQLREKNIDDRTLLARARIVREVTRQNGILFIVNDRPDIARLSDADGVHLGQDDLPLYEARRILGPDAIIGISTHDIAQIRRAILEGASYIGVGPTFPSQTKNFDALAGLDFVKQAMAETSLPAFAIGGITLDNVAQVVAAGASRIAVSAAVCAAADPRLAVATLRAALLV